MYTEKDNSEQKPKKEVNINSYILRRDLELIIENNCQEVLFEGTEVNKHGILDGLIEYLKNTNIKE
jgi:hypothetical protein